jgi:hypothetical protein
MLNVVRLPAFWIDQDAGGSGTGQNPFRTIDNVSFGDSNGSPHRHNLAKATNRSGSGRNRLEKVNRKIDGRIPDSRR